MKWNDSTLELKINYGAGYSHQFQAHLVNTSTAQPNATFKVLKKGWGGEAIEIGEMTFV